MTEVRLRYARRSSNVLLDVYNQIYFVRAARYAEALAEDMRRRQADLGHYHFIIIIIILIPSPTLGPMR